MEKKYCIILGFIILTDYMDNILMTRRESSYGSSYNRGMENMKQVDIYIWSIDGLFMINLGFLMKMPHFIVGEVNIILVSHLVGDNWF